MKSPEEATKEIHTIALDYVKYFTPIVYTRQSRSARSVVIRPVSLFPVRWKSVAPAIDGAGAASRVAPPGLATAADTILLADLTDMAKPYARVLQGLGKVHDGSKRGKPIVSGYAVFESYVRVERLQLFPLVFEPLKAYTGRPPAKIARFCGMWTESSKRTGAKVLGCRIGAFDRTMPAMALIFS
jgi:hypothetical protein